MGGTCGTYGGREICVQGFGGKPEGKRPLETPKHRWDYNIKKFLEEEGRGCGDGMELVQDRDRWWALVSTVMYFGVPYNAGNFLVSCKTS